MCDGLAKADHRIKLEPEVNFSNIEESSSSVMQLTNSAMPQKPPPTLTAENGNTNKSLHPLAVKKLRIAFKCPKCVFLTFSQEELARHKEEEHEAQVNKTCDKSKRDANRERKKEIEAGIEKWKNGIQKQFKCFKCLFSTND